jgi:hypothetical protein
MQTVTLHPCWVSSEHTVAILKAAMPPEIPNMIS